MGVGWRLVCGSVVAAHLLSCELGREVTKTELLIEQAHLLSPCFGSGATNETYAHRFNRFNRFFLTVTRGQLPSGGTNATLSSTKNQRGRSNPDNS